MLCSARLTHAEASAPFLIWQVSAGMVMNDFESMSAGRIGAYSGAPTNPQPLPFAGCNCRVSCLASAARLLPTACFVHAGISSRSPSSSPASASSSGGPPGSATATLIANAAARRSEGSRHANQLFRRTRSCLFARFIRCYLLPLLSPPQARPLSLRRPLSRPGRPPRVVRAARRPRTRRAS